MTLTSQAGATVNDDYVAGSESSGWAVVLDGATARVGVETGCVHDPAWYSRTLGRHLTGLLGEGELADPLTDVLEEAIRRTCADHSDTCDLTNPDSPSAAVALARRTEESLDVLVLADTPVLITLNDGDTKVIKDDRNDFLPDYSNEGVARARNSPGGFWVASTLPAAAREAVIASYPWPDVSAVAVLSDGASRLVDRFGTWEWQELMDHLRKEGPASVIALTRQAESAETQEDRVRGKRRGKQHDDATALVWETA